MASFSLNWDRIRTGLAHAFSTHGEIGAFAPDDLVLLERIADAVIKREMTAPATVFLEALGPMNFLGSQALHFLTPILEVAFNVKELEHVARLLERRDTIDRLITLIEAKSAPEGTQAR